MKQHRTPTEESSNTGGMIRHLSWILLFVLAIASLALAIVPAWIVQPFKQETKVGLSRAYEIKSWSPLLTAVCVALALALVVLLWRGARRWWRKAILILVLFPTLVAAWFARQNHFQWMFNPINEVAHASLNEADYVDPDDKVLAVEINGEAVAYPVRQLAYHHLVNDMVGGVPIVATY